MDDKVKPKLSLAWVEKICKECGITFTTRMCWVRKSETHGSYCSRKCSGLAHSKNIKGATNPNFREARQLAKCLNCGKEFEYFSSERKYRATSYCSRKCGDSSKKGRPTWNKGLDISDPRVERAGLKLRGSKNGMFGRRLSLHPNWLGGKSFEPYPTDWSITLRERVRALGKFTCSICGVNQSQTKRKLHIHHIDYDKTNCAEHNLTPLCNSCHTKTNYRREFWLSYFKEKSRV